MKEDNDMIKLDEKKLAQLKTGSQHLAEKYGREVHPVVKNSKQRPRHGTMQNCCVMNANGRN